MKHIITFIIACATVLCTLHAQQPQQAAPNQPQVVEIRLNQTQQPAQQPSNAASDFVRASQEFGTAIGGGLKNLAREAKDMTFGENKTLVQGLDDLSKTDAGKFTMAIIAWKVAGKDAVDLLDKFKSVVIGVPLFIVLNGLFFWFYRRNFTTYSVLATKEGPFWNSKKTYTVVNDDSSWSDNKMIGAGITGVVWAAAAIGIAVRIIFY